MVENQSDCNVFVWCGGESSREAGNIGKEVIGYLCIVSSSDLTRASGEPLQHNKRVCFETVVHLFPSVKQLSSGLCIVLLLSL